jgi:hypothetical protein
VPHLSQAILTAGPLRIDRVKYADLIATIAGDRFALGILCSWRLIHNGELILDPDQMEENDPAETEMISDKLWDLVGNSIVSVEQSSSNPNDPVFHLTDDYVLQVQADSDIDPWSMTVRGQVFVGVMT